MVKTKSKVAKAAARKALARAVEESFEPETKAALAPPGSRVVKVLAADGDQPFDLIVLLIISLLLQKQASARAEFQALQTIKTSLCEVCICEFAGKPFRLRLQDEKFEGERVILVTLFDAEGRSLTIDVAMLQFDPCLTDVIESELARGKESAHEDKGVIEIREEGASRTDLVNRALTLCDEAQCQTKSAVVSELLFEARCLLMGFGCRFLPAGDVQVSKLPLTIDSYEIIQITFSDETTYSAQWLMSPHGPPEVPTVS